MNRLDSDGEDHPEEGEPIQPLKGWGCSECGCIFTLSTYYVDEMKTFTPRCPNCTAKVKSLGWLPYVVEYSDGFYLIDNNGRTWGPAPTAHDANRGLWNWFKGERNAKAKSIQKGCFRLVASEGQVLDGSDEEESDTKEGSESGAQEETDQAPSSKEES